MAPLFLPVLIYSRYIGEDSISFFLPILLHSRYLSEVSISCEPQLSSFYTWETALLSWYCLFAVRTGLICGWNGLWLLIFLIEIYMGLEIAMIWVWFECSSIRIRMPLSLCRTHSPFSTRWICNRESVMPAADFLPLLFVVITALSFLPNQSDLAIPCRFCWVFHNDLAPLYRHHDLAITSRAPLTICSIDCFSAKSQPPKAQFHRLVAERLGMKIRILELEYQIRLGSWKELYWLQNVPPSLLENTQRHSVRAEWWILSSRW